MAAVGDRPVIIWFKSVGGVIHLHDNLNRKMRMNMGGLTGPDRAPKEMGGRVGSLKMIATAVAIAAVLVLRPGGDAPALAQGEPGKVPSVPSPPEKSCPAADVTKLETLCLASWRESGMRKLLKDDAAKKRYEEAKKAGEKDPLWIALTKPHHVCDAFVEKQYGPLATQINHIRAGVDAQKEVVGNRAQGAARWLAIAQVVVVVLGGLITIGAAWAAAAEPVALPLKAANIVLPAVLTAVTSLVAFFDYSGVYVAESRASMAIRELQSDIEFTLITGCAGRRVESEASRSRAIDLDTVVEWQSRLSTILRADVDSYIKRREITQ